MYTFDYQRAADPKAAVAALAGDSDAKFLAGGQSLLPTMRLRLAHPSKLIDVTRIAALKEIRVDANAVTIGAAVCHADVADHADIQRVLPGLASLASHIGDRQVRALGTIGGSLANNDPAACYPAAALALGATIVTDRRRIAADDFFVGMYETALAPDELITAVEFPVAERSGFALRAGRRVRRKTHGWGAGGRDGRGSIGISRHRPGERAHRRLYAGGRACRHGVRG
jgi:carbon-monoxide dehydrogenase medium subunit